VKSDGAVAAAKAPFFAFLPQNSSQCRAHRFVPFSFDVPYPYSDFHFYPFYDRNDDSDDFALPDDLPLPVASSLPG